MTIWNNTMDLCPTVIEKVHQLAEKGEPNLPTKPYGRIAHFEILLKILLYKCAGWPLNSLNTQADWQNVLGCCITQKNDTLSVNTRMIVYSLERFATSCSRHGNIVNFPTVEIRQQFYSEPVFGRIDAFLYENFQGGALDGCFPDIETFEKWISENHLTGLFELGHPVRDNLDWLAKSQLSIWQLQPSELWAYIDRVTDLMEIRNDMLHER